MSDPKHISVDEDKLNDLFDQLRAACKAFQFNGAKTALVEIMHLVPGVRNSVTVFKNTLTSCAEGLRDKATTKAKVLLDLKEELNVFRAGLDSVLDNLRNPAATSFEEALEQDLGRGPLSVYDKDMNTVQTKVSKTGIFTGYVAVLPLAAPYLDASKLNRKGIPAERFAGYTILNKQFVAGVSNDYLRAHSTMPSKNGVSRRMNKDSGAPGKVLEEFKDLIETRFRALHLQLASTPTSWWDATWFWYINPKELDEMRHCTINDGSAQRVHFKKWSFPFVKG